MIKNKINQTNKGYRKCKTIALPTSIKLYDKYNNTVVSALPIKPIFKTSNNCCLDNFKDNLLYKTIINNIGN